MRSGIFPVFTKGRVVKKESLEYLRDFPYDLASLVCENYTDGILFGFSVSYEDGRIIISKGALKYQGDIIIVPENIVETIEYGRILYITLILGKRTENEDYISIPSEIRVDRNESGAANEVELGRFCLKQGAVLRCEYDSFKDLRTPENTLDITHVSFAGKGAATLHPRVLKEYAGALIADSADAADVAFSLLCMNTGVVHKNCIEWHIAKKTGEPYTEYALNVLYEKLLELLPQHGLKGRAEKTRKRGPSIG